MTKMRMTARPALAALLALGLLAAPATVARAADDVDQKAVARAHGFLNTAKRGRDVLGYVHFGTKYDGHSWKETRFVTSGGKRVPGHFALVYRFDWNSDGTTEVLFLCDARGNVYEVQAGDTNAILQQPFVAANTAIKLLGNLLIEAFKDKMTEAERKDVQKLVDDADARGMLTWSLKFQQSLGW